MPAAGRHPAGDRTGRGPVRVPRLGETAARFPRAFVWRCAALAEALRAGVPASRPQGELREQARQLAVELGGQPVPDGHWLVGSCLLAEAVAELGDRELAEQLTGALRPYAGQVAVAGRVAAFRGSVSYPLGLLALVLGDAETAVDDLTRAAHLHEQMGARPFQARSLAALARALELAVPRTTGTGRIKRVSGPRILPAGSAWEGDGRDDRARGARL